MSNLRLTTNHPAGDSAAARARRLKADILASRKSGETDDPIDVLFYDPIAIRLTHLFMKMKWSANAVTLSSMFFGVGGSFLLYPKNVLLNLLGIAAEIFAAILDCSDGQVARLAHSGSQFGRFLDGTVDMINFLSIYIAVGLRTTDELIPFTKTPWTWYIWPLIILTMIAHAGQARMADYYRGLHLYFLHGQSRNDLARPKSIRAELAGLPAKHSFFRRLYLKLYLCYTEIQVRRAGKTQLLLDKAEECDEQTREEIAGAYIAVSRRYIQITNFLSFNPRAYLFFLLLLCRQQAFYFLFILTVMEGLKLGMVSRYETEAGHLCAELFPDDPACAAAGSVRAITKEQYRAIFFLIGIVGIIVLAVEANPDQLDWQEMLTPMLPLLLLGLLLLWAIIYFAHANVYRIILGDAASNVSLPELYRICLSGFALNTVTPAGLFGGEPYRILELKAFMPTEKATSSTITFSLLYTIGHFLLWLTGAVIYLVSGCPGETYATVLLLTAAFFLFLACLYFFRKKHKGLVIPAFRFFSKLPAIGKKAAAYAEKNASMLAEIDRCYAEFCADRSKLLPAVLLEYLARLLEGAEYFLIFLYLGENIHITGGILILSFASLVGNLLFVVPMQAGTREGGMAIALDFLGISSGIGVMGGLIYRVRDLICTAVGIICILTGGKKRQRQ